MNKEILIKYLNNNCTDKEFEELVGWKMRLQQTLKILSYEGKFLKLI